MSYLISLLVISALIFFHELGHYLAARSMGVFVETFSVGFGKKIVSFHKWGTNWQISLVPLGGYVKMKGQDDSDPSKKSYDEDSYTVKTPVQKIFILFAGPLANFILAFFLYFIIALGGVNVLSPVIGKVVENSPAYEAGFKKNDTVLSINGVKTSTWEEMAKAISSSTGSLNVEIQRDGFVEFKTLTPRISQTKNMFNETVQRKMIGIGALGTTHQLDLGILETLCHSYLGDSILNIFGNLLPWLSGMSFIPMGN